MLSIDDRISKESIESLEKIIQSMYKYQSLMDNKMFIDRGFKRCLDDNLKELNSWYC